jgi:hypothetical protein
LPALLLSEFRMCYFRYRLYATFDTSKKRSLCTLRSLLWTRCSSTRFSFPLEPFVCTPTMARRAGNWHRTHGNSTADAPHRSRNLFRLCTILGCTHSQGQHCRWSNSKTHPGPAFGDAGYESLVVSISPIPTVNPLLMTHPGPTFAEIK